MYSHKDIIAALSIIAVIVLGLVSMTWADDTTTTVPMESYGNGLIDHWDTPEKYEDNAGKILKVGDDELVMEFTDGLDVITSVADDRYVNTAGDTMTGDLNMNDNNIQNVRAIYPTITSVIPFSEGALFWDDTDKCWTYYSNVRGTSNQIGQEIWVYARNNTGANVLNGQVVYINGAQGSRSTLSLAKADAEITSHAVIGFVTQSSIDNNATGYVTVFGYIRDVDTSAFSDGDIIYLSADTAGGITATPPSAPNHATVLGQVVFANAESGIIFVRPQSGFELYELHDVSAFNPSDNSILTWDNDSSFWRDTTTPTLDYITLNNAPTADAHAATKAYVDAGDTPVFFAPYSLSIQQGTLVSGNYTSVADKDSGILVVNETVTNPGFDVTFYYKDINTYNSVRGYMQYLGSISHLVGMDIAYKNFTTWERYSVIESDGYKWYDPTVPDPDEHIDGGEVRVRLYHEGQGVGSHVLRVKELRLSSSSGGGSTVAYATKSELSSHTTDTANPHSVTLDQACDTGNTTDKSITISNPNGASMNIETTSDQVLQSAIMTVCAGNNTTICSAPVAFTARTYSDFALWGRGGYYGGDYNGYGNGSYTWTQNINDDHIFAFGTNVLASLPSNTDVTASVDIDGMNVYGPTGYPGDKAWEFNRDGTMNQNGNRVDNTWPINVQTSVYINYSTGSDAGDGSSGSPYKTWAYVRDNVLPSATLKNYSIIMTGVNSSTLDISNIGLGAGAGIYMTGTVTQVDTGTVTSANNPSTYPDGSARVSDKNASFSNLSGMILSVSVGGTYEDRIIHYNNATSIYPYTMFSGTPSGTFYLYSSNWQQSAAMTVLNIDNLFLTRGKMDGASRANDCLTVTHSTGDVSAITFESGNRGANIVSCPDFSITACHADDCNVGLRAESAVSDMYYVSAVDCTSGNGYGVNATGHAKVRLRWSYIDHCNTGAQYQSGAFTNNIFRQIRITDCINYAMVAEVGGLLANIKDSLFDGENRANANGICAQQGGITSINNSGSIFRNFSSAAGTEYAIIAQSLGQLTGYSNGTFTGNRSIFINEDSASYGYIDN